MQLVVLRHGRTAWNADHRIQGRSDQPLDDHGRRQVRTWQLLPEWRSLPCIVSPLQRARETAEILGFSNVRRDERLIEMDWGRYCGRRIADLRDELGEAFRTNEARGVDFCPQDGESPRQVANRVGDIVCELARTAQDHICVTHKGVRRAMIVLATGWNMLGRAPLKLTQDDAMILDISPDGVPRLAGQIPLRDR